MTSQNISPRNLWFSVAFLLAVMLLSGSFQRGMAQTNTFPDTGNAGVGTLSPASILTIQTTGPDSGATKYLRVKNTSSYTGVLLDPGQAGDAGWLLMGGYPSAGDFTIREFNVANYLTIKKTTGYVGIGITAPNYKLDVQGGQINSSGGLCIAGVCKTDWSQVTAFSSVTAGTSNVALVVGTGGSLTASGAGTINATTLGGGTFAAPGAIGATTPGTGTFTTITATNGASISNLSASNLASGMVAIGRLGTGTPDVTKFLRGDNSWAAVQTAFSNLTAGTNTGALIVGTGGSLTTSGSGTINATSLGGTTFAAPGAIGATTRGTGAFSTLGVNTGAPSSYKLDVNGTAHVSGDITVDGNIAAKYQDVAEWVPASEKLAAGTVVVLDATKPNQVTSSTIAYDTRVAGVVSEQPGIALGESGVGKVLVATTGRVKVKVDATKSRINIGDLLVTSEIPGVAMKSEPINLGGVQIHRPGTLIGKALEPLEKGKGEILVLLSLQ